MLKESELQKKVGQMLVVGIPGTAPKKENLAKLAKLGVGGVVLFKNNYESIEQVTELTNSIQMALHNNTYENLPGWICLDHEGGRVHRLRSPFTHFPNQQLIGKLNSPKLSYDVGYAMGAELKSVGINCNFAPVIDVNRIDSNAAIGDRSFGADPEIVASLGSALARGIQKAGVLAVAKHFPGHGHVSVDSHVDLPVCDLSLEELEATDWVPFRRIVRSKVEGIMTAHVLYPKVDADKPATFSRTLIQNHLRKQIRHQRLVFTDDLEMGAVVKKYSLKDAGFLAIQAGCDHLLYCHEWDEIESIAEYLVGAFESGALPMSLLDESIQRIRNSKKEILMPFVAAEVSRANEVVGCRAHIELLNSLKAEGAQ